MKKIYKFSIYCILTTISSIALQKFCRSKTDGFAESKIRATLPFHEPFEIKNVSSEDLDLALKALDQPYFYLGKGAQCYAFVSKDDQYVIKFFRLDRLCPSSIYTLIPLTKQLDDLRKERIARKFEELSRDFLSYKYAYEALKNPTGLIYVQLNAPSKFSKILTVYDKISVKHTIDLSEMHFLIQKKGELFYTSLEELISLNKIDEAKARLTELVEYLVFRSKLGLYDKDPDINTNFGICNNQTIQIDTGRFRYDPSRIAPDIYIADIIRITDNLHQWLDTKNSSLSLFLNQEIERLKKESL